MPQNTNSGKKPRHSQVKKRSKLKTALLVILGLIVLAGVSGLGLFVYYAQSAPKITYNSLSSDNSTKFYDSKGRLISRMGAQNRDYVKSANIPTNLKNAVISIEDRRFYKHHGVDPIRILGAATANVTGSSLGLQGGSTLTQQLVKLSVFSTAASDQTLKRKAQEAWLAIQVENKYSKSQILEFYINKVYMGNGVYGMQTAAEYYYNKPLSKLSLAQLAMIAGMPQSPTNYNPYKYPTYATQRRNEVLQAMAKNKVITSAQASQAEAQNVQAGLAKTHTKTNTSLKTAKYIDAYLQDAISELEKKGYKVNSGLKVYTNLNMKAQKSMYKTANSSLTIAYPSKKFQLGATMVNVNNGKVVAMQGNRKNKVSFGLNRAVQTDRSSGSTAKPLMDFGPAIEYLKYPTYQPVKDTPYTYPGTDKSLMDFDNRYEGTITMRKALVESRNIPAIRTLENVGVDRAQDFLKNLGMNFDKPLELQNGIGLYISSKQEAAAYAAFANGGTYYEPYLVKKVVQSNGKTTNYKSKGKRAMSEATAFMITNMLKGVMDSSDGSGTAAKISGLYEAGKTGTTQYPSDYLNKVPEGASMDAWFTGYTRNYSLSIWTGYDRQFKAGHYITQEQSKISQEYYREVMATASANKDNLDWQQPGDVVQTEKNGNTEYYVAGYPGTSTDSSSSQAGAAAYSDATAAATSSSANSQVTEPTTNGTTNNNSNNYGGSTSSNQTQEPSGSGGNGNGGGTDDNDNTTADSSSDATASSDSTATADNSDSSADNTQTDSNANADTDKNAGTTDDNN
ncbi:PBP1A family penicillin-binding protein [Lentilactobacillus senioris]|uniref:PBP1A family penicillin-binding protein n=1 Tax=Lentilactobacillus senioris TaxID=931534 RepID=UPI00227F89DF|nr:PBP1A family penicillin-binding protein [Lentilactobacillus senioris]MCY9806847.1 PBP1A family penicillin-binding protein [Lentilactobacillus senioris]